MTREELKKQQEDELAHYWQARGERQEDLRREQQEMLQHITVTGPKGQEYLDRMFRQQREAWMDFEKDEFSQLTYWQEYERENFSDKEAKRNRILSWLRSDPDKAKDRGRD